MNLRVQPTVDPAISRKNLKAPQDRLCFGHAADVEASSRDRDEGRPAYALAPVYERRPSRQKRDASTNAAMVPRMRNPRPSGSSRPAMTCAGTVTATPIGTALESVTRSQPGYTSTGNLPASMNDQ